MEEEEIALTEVPSGDIDNINESEQTSHSNTPLLPDRTKRILRGPLAPVNNFINVLEENITEFISNHNRVLKFITCIFILLGYLAYLIFACVLNFKRASVLLYLTLMVVFCFIYWFLKQYFGKYIWTHVKELYQTHSSERRIKITKCLGVLLFVGLFIFWIIYDTIKFPNRLVSLAGLLIYIFIGYMFSRNRDRIIWRPVIVGFILQFILGLVMLRTYIGFEVFRWISERIKIFLGFSSAGKDFLFKGLDQTAFQFLPIIVYFAAVTYVLYYLGWIQIIIAKLAWLLHVTMGTSPAESVNAAGNIFIGQTEAPLLIRPFLHEMTESELHAVLTGGFATIAGTVFAIYVSFGISAHHLLTASVMSAPAALAMSKLMCPEIEEPKVKNVDDIHVEATDEKNIFEAVTVGAAMSIGLVANIVVMLIAFLSLLECANSILGWFGSMVGAPQFSFEYICSYVFMPFAYIMGVSWNDSFEVAKLIGTKTFVNEFVAYKDLSYFIKNRIQGTGRALSIRSEIITTYALCGFANFGSMGIQLGGISALAPSKRGVLSKLVFRALIAGSLACFTTACIAGVLYEEDQYDTNIHPNTTAILNTTIVR